MMVQEILITYLHFLGFISIFVSIAIEKVLFKKELTVREANTIRIFDAIYGLAAVVMLATGFAKMNWFGKGMDYYMHNHIFWTKILLFSIVGILSVYPTVTFFKWKKVIAKNESISLSDGQFKLISRILTAEIILMILIPLCAHFMARGFGYVN